MKTIHLDRCASTQDVLSHWIKENPDYKEPILVSTSEQTAGKGRRGNQWQFLGQSLAFSFTLAPNPTLSLTSLEVGILVAQYFEVALKAQIKLKWPNDLFNLEKQKCGGILIQFYEQDTLMVGIGINIKSDGDENILLNHDDFRMPVGFINLKGQISNQQEELPKAIYNWILNNRMSSVEVQKKWKEYCIHLNQKVQIDSDQKIYQGTFMGITSLGEAILEHKEKKSTFMSGTLSF